MRINSDTAMLLMLATPVAYYFTADRHGQGEWWFLVSPAAFLLAPFVLGPFLIHRTQRIKLRPTFKPFDPRGPEASPEASAYFDAIEGDLDRLGFELTRAYSLSDIVANAKGSTTLFQNPKTLEVIRMIAAVGVNGVIRDVAVMIVCTTEFSDGTEVCTSNSRTARIYPRLPPPFHGFTLPGIREADRLLAVHRALVRRYEGGRTRVDAVGDDPDAYLRYREHLRTLDHQTACGYSYPDEWAGVQRPTWKGAILMTWKLAWPIKPIRLALRRVEARKLLRELEAEGLEI